jgi:hypothetical protein
MSLPPKFGESPLYPNANQTLPMPNPPGATMPAAIWSTTWTQARWEAAPGNPIAPSLLRADPPLSYVYSFTLSTPAFDLKPELRSATAGPKNGVPIWNKAARLYVNVRGLLDAPLYGGGPIPATVGLTAVAQDSTAVVIFNQTTEPRPGAVNEPRGTNSVVPTGSPANVTASLLTPPVQRDTALLMFAPPGSTLGGGDGYPVRYWSLSITFTKVIRAGVLPPTIQQLPRLSFQAAVY